MVLRGAHRFLVLAYLYEKICLEIGDGAGLGYIADDMYGGNLQQPLLSSEGEALFNKSKKKIKSVIEGPIQEALLGEFDERAASLGRPGMIERSKADLDRIWEFVKDVLEEDRDFHALDDASRVS
jgi:hypothetical protein